MTAVNMVVAKENPGVCRKMRQRQFAPGCGYTGYLVLASALWPFSTLGWPDETEELDYFYPTKRFGNRL